MSTNVAKELPEELVQRIQLYAVGKVVGVFGVGGYLKVRAYSLSSERLKKLRNVLVGKTAETTAVFSVEDVVFKNRQWMMKLQGVEDRTAGLKLIGSFLFVEESRIEPPAKGTYFSHDVIGCAVVNEEGLALGTIEDIYAGGAHDLWAVRTKNGVSLIPAVKEFIRRVDVREKKVTVRVIEGLIDDGESVQ